MTVDAIAHFFSDGVYCKQLTLLKGHIALTHKHCYDHLSILAQGTVEITLNGLKTRFNAPTCIEIKAGIEHQIEALADSTFFCVHSSDEKDSNKIDETLIGDKNALG